MIKTKNLTKIFTTAEVETTALNNVNMELQDGEFVAIMGPSGCGKSTFLHIAGMLDSPTDGEYYFMGEEVSNYSEKKRAGLRKGNIGPGAAGNHAAQKSFSTTNLRRAAAAGGRGTGGHFKTPDHPGR